MMAIKLADAYADLGFDVHFFYFFGNVPTGSESSEIRYYKLKPFFMWGLDRGDSRNILEKVYLQVLDLINFIGSLLLVLSIRKKVGCPSIIHFNKIRGLSGFVFLWSKYILRSKVYYTAHDYEFFSPNAKSSAMSGFGAIYRKLKSPFLRFVDRFFCPSQYVLHVYKSCYPHLNNGNNLANFSFVEVELGADEEKKYKGGVLGYLGRLESIKGVEELCAAFIKSNCKKLVIGGGGSLADRIAEYSAEDQRIEFRGVLDEVGKKSFFHDIDFLVVPSVWEEVYGLVVVESFVNRVPVIVSDQGGLPELISSGISGEVLKLSEINNSDVFAFRLDSIFSRCVGEYESYQQGVDGVIVRDISSFVRDLSIYLSEDEVLYAQSF